MTGGGADNSTLTTLSIANVPVAFEGSTDVVFDLVLADVPDNTIMFNTAQYDATPEGDSGSLSSPPVTIRRDGDLDTIFDTDDNCPDVFNTDQIDLDDDGIGDVCDDAVEIDTETATDTDIDTDTGTDADSDTDTDTDADADTDTDTDADADTDSDADADSNSDRSSDASCACTTTGASSPGISLIDLVFAALVD